MKTTYAEWPSCGVIARVSNPIGIDFNATCASNPCETEIEAEKQALIRMEIFCLKTARVAKDKYEQLIKAEREAAND